jgi:uncharacterized protein with HEPN domain
VLGEATRRLSARFKLEHHEIPWDDIAGMRNRGVRGYDQVDLEIGWQVTQTSAPKLAQYLEAVVPKPRPTASGPVGAA